MATKIQWTDATWNPVRGCTRISPGCVNCYAERMAARNLPEMRSPSTGEAFAITTPSGPRWTGKLELIESKLFEPLRWLKPKRVFVNSMSDLFHESLNPTAIDQVFAVMAMAPHVTFQVLTKRADLLHQYVNEEAHLRVNRRIAYWLEQNLAGVPTGRAFNSHCGAWPLPNVWLGVSAESQEYAEERIPLLLNTPAALRFVSYEPALGPVNFENVPIPGSAHPTLPMNVLRRASMLGPRIDWVIVGGESGPGARPFNVAWARNAVRQCNAADISVFVKQMGSVPIVAAAAQEHLDWEGGSSQPRNPEGSGIERLKLHDNKGGDSEEWPDYLRVRQIPGVSD